MCLERRLQLSAVVLMNTIDPFRDGTDAAGRGQPEHRPPSARAVELLARAGSHSHSPSFAPSAASASRCSFRLSAFSARVRSVTSSQSSVAPPTTGRTLDLERPGARGGWHRKTARASAACHFPRRRRSFAEAGSCQAPAPPPRVNGPALAPGDSRESVRAHRSTA